MPSFEGGDDWNMRRHYELQRKTFIITFALYQCATWTTAMAIGTFGWNVISVVRAAILVILVLMLLLNRRWADWIGVLAILAVLVFRLTTQVVR